ncbi:tetratricopeptide repeat protein [Streptomyces cylindrosporus]|uniref:Tetratricopeptide repeat protein n=1 Tax=Streptomyces cylindrosporus TaxID=2927583 RepID=A0ABS9Y569_9ACTN|nr:tetratricopeptide repeat protein [Streptomyces cylindrosporus]MCI3272372.1 tetratricopeptide repeat protein [Streptomyces cylindrosporus]
MRSTGLSVQELIARRRRAGFVGRGAERAAFRGNFDVPPTDERHRFMFHVHGNAGVGKTFLVRELEQIAREKGALTAYVDESVGSVPEAMAAISRQFAGQGRRFKELDRLLTTYRERRHEAEAATVVVPQPEGPSAGSLAAARAGLVGLGMLPGVGAFAGALDAAQLAQGADRLRAGLSARFRNQEDAQLVLSPERVLTPALLAELSEAACSAPWIVLFFDTYERTGPFLDSWLHETMTTDRHGALPAAVVIVTAGQHSLDTTRWGGFADFITDLPLGPFSEAEARGLLAGKGVVAEPVVEEVLRLTGGLPVLVSTLAGQRPTDPDDIGDPSATAVERFLKWEHDPVRRAAALACALPRRLDMDVFRAAADCSDDETAALFGWLRGLPFVDDRDEWLRYHDLVREPMLRLQRRRFRRGWTERHERLADVFGRRRAEATRDLRSYEEWESEQWRELRLEETYHLLCAHPHAALAEALRALVEVCGTDEAAGRQWARTLEEAGDATATPALREWGRSLGEALADDASGLTKAMDLLLARPGLDSGGRALAHTLRGAELRSGGKYAQALAEYDRAIELDSDCAPAHHGRGLTQRSLGDFSAALAAFDRADELVPGKKEIIAARGETYRQAERWAEAIADLDRCVTLDPTDAYPVACRAVCRHALEQYDEALADFDRALSLDEGYVWVFVRRARLYRARAEWDEAFADLDRAVALAPDSAWVASERGDAYRLAGRFEEAVTELGRAVALDADYDSALASRGEALHRLGRNEEALADLGRAVELDPDYAWALVMRARVRKELDDEAGMFEDLHRAVEADPEVDWTAGELAEAYRLAGRYDEAVVFFRRSLEQDPGYGSSLARLGATHFARGDYAEALRCLNRALEVHPDYGWALSQRAQVSLATGRVEKALDDWDRRLALGGDDDTARYMAIETLILAERWQEARARLADADGSAVTGADLDDLRVDCLRHTGQWEEARQLAERIRADNAVAGTYQLAMIASQCRGREDAEPLWHELAHLLDTSEPDEEARKFVRCVIDWGLADWAAADRDLARALTTECAWDDLALLADALTGLRDGPGADRERLTAYLATVTLARDAVKGRYTE